MSKRSRAHDERLAENLRQVCLQVEGGLISLYPEGLSNRIICPLCWRSFHIDENAFTNEHVPARVVSHLFTTRTCKHCNDRAGSQLEGELQKHNEFWNVLQKRPNTSFDARVTTSDSQAYNATIYIDESGQSKIEVQRKRNDPTVFEFLSEKFSDDTKAFFKPIDGGNDRRAQIAILKAAYLTAFRHFGYGYLFSSAYPVLRLITAQIGNPEESILPDFGLTPVPDNFELSLINIITTISHLNGFFIVFNFGLQPSTMRRVGVVLPSASGDSSLLYETCKEYVGTRIGGKFFRVDKLQNYTEVPMLASKLCQLYIGSAS